MVAVDGLIDDGGRILGPYNENCYTAPTLDATIKWDNPRRTTRPEPPRTARTTSSSATRSGSP